MKKIFELKDNELNFNVELLKGERVNNYFIAYKKNISDDYHLKGYKDYKEATEAFLKITEEILLL